MPRFRFIKRRISIIAFCIAVVLVLLHVVGWSRPIENLVIGLLSPIQQRVFGVGSTVNQLYAENSQDPVVRELQDQVKELAVENAQLKTLLGDLEQLEAQNFFLASTGLEGVTARVIGRNPEPDSRVIIINRGERDGVHPGAPVIADNGILVGVVQETRQGSATALLISDRTSKIAAAIQNADETAGIVEGEHGLSLRLELIPQNADVQQGQTIITSGLETGIPPGLVIGTIDRVVSSANAFFKTAYVTPLVDLNALNVVSILTLPFNE